MCMCESMHVKAGRQHQESFSILTTLSLRRLSHLNSEFSDQLVQLVCLLWGLFSQLLSMGLASGRLCPAVLCMGSWVGPPVLTVVLQGLYPLNHIPTSISINNFLLNNQRPCFLLQPSIKAYSKLFSHNTSYFMQKYYELRIIKPDLPHFNAYQYLYLCQG